MTLGLGEYFSCAGRTALVTGGASGIGAACARALAAAGAHVVIAGLAESRPEDAAAELRAEGAAASGIACDVLDDGDLERAVDAALDRTGRLDHVVANAGMAIEDPVDGASAAGALDRMHRLHVRSPLRLAELALPHMAGGGGGAFLIMSSLSGLRGNARIGAYGMTKAANAQLARNLAVQWGGRGIRANAISPGVIATGFAEPITGDPSIAAARLAKTPLGRFGAPSEVAAAVVWLCSPGGAFVTGQNIVIDGGTLVAD